MVFLCFYRLPGEETYHLKSIMALDWDDAIRTIEEKIDYEELYVFWVKDATYRVKVKK